MELSTTPQIDIKRALMLERIKNILLISYAVLETMYKTIAGKYAAVEMERLQCGVAILLVMLLIVEFFRLDGANKKKWLIKHSPVIIYFIIRCVTFVHVGFAYTMLRSMLFEAVYLIVFTELIVNGKFCRDVVFKFFIIANLVLNVFNTFFYLYAERVIVAGTYAEDAIYNFIVNYTYIDNPLVTNYCSMYSNPNQIGVMTGMAVLLSLIYLSKSMSTSKKILFGLYFAFSLYCIWYSNCSSSHVGLLAAGLAFVLVSLIRFITPRRVVILCLICAILATGGIYGFISMQDKDAPYSETEALLDNLSTKRYTIWKDSYFSHQEELILGCGNITMEKRDRYQYNLDRGIDGGFDVNSSLVEYVGPHNGYIGMLSCTGILGSLAFFAAFIKKLLGAKMLTKKKYYYLTIVFILTINLFECMTVVSKNFCCLYLFLILAMEDEEEK